MNKIIFGYHPFISILKYNYFKIIKIFIVKKYVNLIKKIIKLKLYFEIVDNKWLNKITHFSVHQGIIAYIKDNFLYNYKYIIKCISYMSNPLFLILNNIIDPHNLGSCLRSANAFGVNVVIISGSKCVKITSTVVKVACGAIETLPIIYVNNLFNIFFLLKKYNFYIIGTELNSKTFLFNIKLNKPTAFIIGAENTGIKNLYLKYCNILIKIPMFGHISSLNVSVATAICLFEFNRQYKII